MADIKETCCHSSRSTKRVSDYDKNKKHRRHKDVDIPKTRYLGVTSEVRYLLDMELRSAQYLHQQRLRPGRRLSVTSMRQIIRQPHRVKLTPKRWKELIQTVKAVFGPGLLVDIDCHIPTKEKIPGHGVPGPELNFHHHPIKKIGPFLIPLRDPDHSHYCALRRAVDQLTRAWNRDKTQQPIKEMNQARDNQLQHRRLFEILADQEETLWLRKNFAPKDVSAFRSPPFQILAKSETACAELRSRGFEITIFGKDPVRTNTKRKKPIPKAKVGFWLVRNKSWDSLRQDYLGADNTKVRRTKIILDGVRVLVEARSLFRARMMEREKKWILEAELAAKKATVMSIASPVPEKVIERSHSRRIPLLPEVLIHRIERSPREPLKTIEEASELLTRMEYPVQPRRQVDQKLEIGAASCRVSVLPAEILISIQLSLLRGLIMGRSHTIQPQFYVDRGQRVEFVSGQANSLIRNPFDPVWAETYDRLRNSMVVDDWLEASRSVQMNVPQDSAPISKCAHFYKFLADRVKMKRSVAFALTCLHFRSSAEPFAAFAASLENAVRPRDEAAEQFLGFLAKSQVNVTIPPLPRNPAPPIPKSVESATTPEKVKAAPERVSAARAQQNKVEAKPSPAKVSAQTKVIPLTVDLPVPKVVNQIRPKTEPTTQQELSPAVNIVVPAIDSTKTRTKIKRAANIGDLLACVQTNDAVPTNIQDLQSIADRVGVIISPLPEPESEAVTLEFSHQSKLTVNQSELALYIGLAIIRATLPGQIDQMLVNLEFDQIKSVGPDDRGLESRRWLVRVGDQLDYIRTISSDPTFAESWQEIIKSTRNMTPPARTAELYRSLVMGNELRADAIFVVLVSIVPPKLDIIQSLGAVVQGLRYER